MKLKPILRIRANSEGVKTFHNGKFVDANSRTVVPAWKELRSNLKPKETK